MFYVAPLFLIALLGLDRPGACRGRLARPRSPLCVAAALPGVLPYHRLIDVPARSPTRLRSLPLWWLQETVVRLDTIPIVVVAVGRGDRPALPLRLAALRARPAGGRAALVRARDANGSSASTTASPRRRSAHSTRASLRRRTGLGRCRGRAERGRRVSSSRTGTRRHHPDTLWENEFFNRSVGPVYDLRQPSMGGLPETNVTQRADGVLLADGKPVRHRYVLSEESVPLAGSVVSRDELKGMALRRTHGFVRIGYRVAGPLRERHLVRQDRHVHAPALHGRASDRDGRERPEALQRAADGQGGRRERDVRARPRGNTHGAAARRRRHVPRRVHGYPDRRAGWGGPARARRALPRVPLRGPVRIAYDVTPLSHPRTGVGNYILGALKGMLEAPVPSDEVVAFGPVSIRGRRLLDEALEGLNVEKRFLTVPFAHATRTCVGRVRQTAGRALPRRLRRPALHATGCCPPQRAGIRATMIHDLGPLRFPERLHPRTVRMHSATAREAERCDVVFANSSYTANDVVETLGLPFERVHVAYPGVDARFRPQGERRNLGRPYVFTTATRGLAQEPAYGRRASPSAVAPRATCSSRSLGHGALAATSPDDELPALYRGAEVFVYPSRFEGFGIPIIEAMACGVPCVVSSHPSLDEASRRRRRARRPREPRGVRGGDPPRARRARRARRAGSGPRTPLRLDRNGAYSPAELR